MIPVNELKNENKEIDDLRKVLSELVEIPEMHGNSVFCELLERFQAKLNNHLKHEARSLYPELLSSKDNDVNNLAKRFLDNTHELERLLGKYVKHWCHKLQDAELEKFIKETEEVFHLVEERIKLEEKHLFPAMQAYVGISVLRFRILAVAELGFAFQGGVRIYLYRIV